MQEDAAPNCVVVSLAHHLATDDAGRAWAIWRFNQHGRASAEDIHELRRLTGDPDWEVRVAAHTVLYRHGGDQPPFERLLIDGLKQHLGYELLIECIESVHRLADPSDELLRALRVRQDDPRPVYWSDEPLGRQEDQRPAIRHAIVNAACPDVSATPRYAAAPVGTPNPVVLDILTTAADTDPDPENRLWAMARLWEYTGDGRGYVHRVLAELRRPDPAALAGALEALRALGQLQSLPVGLRQPAADSAPPPRPPDSDDPPETVEFVTGFLALLRAGQLHAQVKARSLGPDPVASAAVPACVGLLAHPDQYVRCAAAGALWAFGPDAAPAVPALIEQLADPDAGVRRAAAMALAAIGPEAAAALPALRLAASDAHYEAGQAAEYAIRQVAPGV